jgi:hypothetical protein
MPSFIRIRSRIFAALLAAASAAGPLAVNAQVVPAPQPPPPQMPAAYPQGYVQQVPVAPRPNPLRELFAGTLAAVLQASGGAVVAGVAGGVTHWFDRKQRKAAANYGAPATYPGTSYGSPYTSANPYGTTSQATPSSPYGTSNPYTTTNPYGTTSPSSPDGTTHPYTTTNPSTPNAPYTNQPYGASTPAYPAGPATSDPYGTGSHAGVGSVYPSQTSGYDWSGTQVYDPRTGAMTSAQAGGYSLATQTPNATSIVAGGAYDVHAIAPGGVENLVNAATHEFRTGDRFKVYFRPTLPGRMDVYNINPHGRETRIDSIDLAAGQLSTLGPYEFAATKGDEALRFVLSPCSTQQLLATTRDIVNVGAYGQASPTGAVASMSGLNLASCGAPTTRSVDGVRTRDIQKVGVDGTTSFALDPVSQAELASGQLAAREFTVYFHHR